MDPPYRNDPSGMMPSIDGLTRPDYYHMMEIPCHYGSVMNNVFSIADVQKWEVPEQVNLNKSTPPSVHHLQSDYCGAYFNSCSQYTLDVIFHNLIRPDVSESHIFTLDTLLQSVPNGPSVQGTQHCIYSPTKKRGTLSGKRKRSHDSSFDYDTQKRLRNDAQSYDSSLYHPGVAHGMHRGRRMKVPTQKRMTAFKR